MIGLSADEIKKKIMAEKGLSEEEVNRLVKEKISALSNLVSEQGASIIVANELGVQIISEQMKAGELKIKELTPGLRNVTVTARVAQLLQVREFEKNGVKSKVGNFLISDGTGTCRAVIWDSRVSLIENNELKVNDVIRIHNAYVKDNPYSGLEVHLRERSKLEVNPADDPELPLVEETEVRSVPEYARTMIKDLKETSLVEVLGTVVQVIVRDPFFEVCENCGSRLVEEAGEWKCKLHGPVKSVGYRMVLNLVLDDGTGNIRCVFFGGDAEKVLGVTASEAKQGFPSGEEFLKAKEADLLGKQLLVKGKVSLNNFTNRLELTARDVSTSFNVVDEVKNAPANPVSEKTSNGSSPGESVFEQASDQVEVETIDL